MREANSCCAGMRANNSSSISVERRGGAMGLGVGAGVIIGVGDIHGAGISVVVVGVDGYNGVGVGDDTGYGN